MPWARLDDNFIDNPKLLAASASAKLLWIWSIGWGNRKLTDGFIAENVVPILAAMTQVQDYETVAGELVKLALWERVRGGYKVHDFLKYNKSKETIERERAEAQQRMQEARSRDVRPNTPRTDGEPNANLNRPVPRTPYPVTQDPDPVPEPQESGATARPAAARALFATLAKCCNYSAARLTASERGEINAAVKALGGAHYSPDDVETMAGNWYAHFEDCTMTPSAIAKHASRLMHPPDFARGRTRDPRAASMAEKFAIVDEAVDKVFSGGSYFGTRTDVGDRQSATGGLPQGAGQPRDG